MSLRHITHGYIIPKRNLANTVEWVARLEASYCEKLSFSLADRIIDWKLARYPMGEMFDLLTELTRVKVSCWLNSLPRRVKTAKTNEDLGVLSEHYYDKHVGGKAFVLFKLRCQIAVAQDEERRKST